MLRSPAPTDTSVSYIAPVSITWRKGMWKDFKSQNARKFALKQSILDTAP